VAARGDWLVVIEKKRACVGAIALRPSLRAQQSNPFFLCGAMDCFASLAMTARLDGLLRGAFYRARIRATRWLAMTARLFEN
jgi:hypothetical protein